MPSGAQYFRPTTLREAAALLGSDPDLRIVAGSTDHFPARVAAAPRDRILDVTGIDGLAGVTVEDNQVSIGAATRWSDIRDADLPPAFDGLRAAAAEVGGAQIQNQGTLAGNLCNASPAADGIPPLLTLDATVVLTHADGQRRLPLRDFLTGYRATDLRPGEILTAVEIPRPTAGTRGGFLKLGARRYLVISIVMVAATLQSDKDGRIAKATVSIGACSPVALRLTALEQALQGKPLGPDLTDAIQPGHFDALSPIDDVRAPAAYRLEVAQVLTRRLIADLAQSKGGDPR